MSDLPDKTEQCDPSAVDLTLVSTADLWRELSSRYDTCAFLYANDVTKRDYTFNIHWKGCGIYVLGIVEWARSKLLMHLNAPQEDRDGT